MTFEQRLVRNEVTRFWAELFRWKRVCREWQDALSVAGAGGAREDV